MHTAQYQQHVRASPPEPDAVLALWSGCPEAETAVELLMAETVSSLAGPLAAPIGRVLMASGKRLRPALTVSFGSSCGAPGASSGVGSDAMQAVIQRAAAVELLHCATLVHDDLIDGSAVRRGVPAVSAQEGAPTAVVAGDLLIAAAFWLAGRANQHAVVILARTLVELCRGEALEEQRRFDAGATEEELLEVIRAKTGSLLRAACLLGSAGSELDGNAAVAEYGMEFGICLQLVDDLLDVASSSELSGKPVGADFRTGTVTLPASVAIAVHPELASLLRPGLSPVDAQRSVELLRCPEAISASIGAAFRHAEQAARALLSQDRPDRQTLRLARLPIRYVQHQLHRKLLPELKYLIAPRELSA